MVDIRNTLAQTGLAFNKLLITTEGRNWPSETPKEPLHEANIQWKLGKGLSDFLEFSCSDQSLLGDLNIIALDKVEFQIEQTDWPCQEIVIWRVYCMLTV